MKVDKLVKAPTPANLPAVLGVLFALCTHHHHYYNLIIKTVHYQAVAIGGEEAEVNEFPWAALLLLRSSETNRTSRCGGTLITDRHVLTAAHCLREFSNKGKVNDVWDDTTVVLGEIEMRI